MSCTHLVSGMPCPWTVPLALRSSWLGRVISPQIQHTGSQLQITNVNHRRTMYVLAWYPGWGQRCSSDDIPHNGVSQSKLLCKSVELKSN